MSAQHSESIIDPRLAGAELLRKRSHWFVVLGIVLVVLGFIALSSSVLFTLASMVFIGWLMTIGGILQTVQAFRFREWEGFFVNLLTGLLYSVAGFLIVIKPGVTAVALTLLISVLLMFGGVFRIATAIAVRLPNRLWLTLHGLINLVLGTCILQEWPVSGFWVIGVFIGVDMICDGWSLIMLGLTAKSLSTDGFPA